MMHAWKWVEGNDHTLKFFTLDSRHVLFAAQEHQRYQRSWDPIKTAKSRCYILLC